MMQRTVDLIRHRKGAIGQNQSCRRLTSVQGVRLNTSNAPPELRYDSKDLTCSRSRLDHLHLQMIGRRLLTFQRDYSTLLRRPTRIKHQQPGHPSKMRFHHTQMIITRRMDLSVVIAIHVERLYNRGSRSRPRHQLQAS